MKYKSLLLLFLLLSFNLFSQKIKLKTQAKLSQKLWESSGLVVGTNNTVWTHNDSGGKAVIYKLNTKGEIIKELKILSVKNTDWEDMANDYKGFVYIADIGNNRNRRKDLKILKIPHPDSLKSDSVLPQIISFSYENQTAFPPEYTDRNFDAEALIAYEDSLFIFTKNRTKPYSKYTYIYALANRAGQQKAILTDSLYLKRTHKYSSWVTSASRHPNKDIVVLLSHKKAWIIYNFRNKSKQKLVKTKTSGIYSQKEAIAFDMEENIWITNEKYKFLKAKLKKGKVVFKE